jgi:transcriptional regulator with XRE-family HTH domain
MYYAACHKRGMMIEALSAYARDRGLTQVELAQRLGISQGHLSKILMAKVAPGPKLARKIELLLGHASTGAPASQWGAAVIDAAEASPEFRNLVDAALSLMQKYSKSQER